MKYTFKIFINKIITLSNIQDLSNCRKACLYFLVVLLSGMSAQAQLSESTISFDQKYFKSKTVFHKLTWINKEGSITREATLKLTSQIDSVKRKLTYVQVRNDGKKDSTICELGSLKPIYTVSTVRDQSFIYDYSSSGSVKYTITRNGKIISEDKFNVAVNLFDGFVSEYLLGALPLSVGYIFKFNTFRADLKGKSETLVENTFLEISTKGGNATPTYILSIKSEGLSYLVWVDKKSKEVLKVVFPLQDGGAFVKERI